MRNISFAIALSALTSIAGSAVGADESSAVRQGGPAGAPAAVMVPAGTVVNVRLTQAVEVDTAQTGQTIKARVDDPIMIDGRTIIPREAGAIVQAVKVAQSGQYKGSDSISLKLNALSFGGRTYDVVTEYATVQGKGEGKKTARKIGGGAGLGAIVGGIAGGGEGAAIGAAIGAVGGTAVAASGQEHLKLPAETRLQFKLTSAIRIEP
jgi:hypothetical protein